MPKVTFTKKKIDSIKFADSGRVMYWDTDTKGLGLAVGMNTKTFLLQMDVKDTTKKSGYRTIKKTLGRYGDDITLEQAREMIRGHVDKETGEAVMGERLKLKVSSTDNAPAAGKDVTLKMAIDKYFSITRRRDGKERKAGTAEQYTKLVTRHYAGWLDMVLPEISAITPDVVLEKYRSNETEFGRATARNSSAVLSSVLNYAKATYPQALCNNPLSILSDPHVSIRQAKKARHEYLVYDSEKHRNDFPVFYNGLQVCAEAVRDGFLFCLYTGMRRAEVEKLQWSNIDLEHKELLIKDTKNRQDLHIPLNRQAVTILLKRREGCQGDWIFPSARSGGRGQGTATGHIQLNPVSLKKHTGLDMTIHGLRRTFITQGRKLKRYEDTDRLTNHVDSSMAGKHYDETDIEDLRETCQMIGNEIERRMLAETAKVIDFPSARQAA
jgi:integrase